MSEVENWSSILLFGSHEYGVEVFEVFRIFFIDVDWTIEVERNSQLFCQLSAINIFEAVGSLNNSRKWIDE